MGSTKAIALGQLQSVTRLGLAADVATQTTTNLFTVTGTVVLVTIFGRVVVQKQATGQFIRLGHVPTVPGAECFLCAISGTTTADDVDTYYQITGEITDALIVAPAALGVSNISVNAAGLVGVPQGLVLVDGILRMTTTTANDNSGLINWTALYYRIAATGGGVPAPTDGMTVL